MLNRINKMTNNAIANFCEKDLGLRKKLVRAVTKKMENSSSKFLQDFGVGLMAGSLVGNQIGMTTPAFYRKYETSCFPLVWRARDLIKEFDSAMRDGIDTEGYLKRALDR